MPHLDLPSGWYIMRPYFTLVGLIVFPIELVKRKSDKTVNNDYGSAGEDFPYQIQKAS